jgi:hypothetical protein
VDCDGERRQDLAAGRPSRGRSDQHALFGIGDELDETFVAGLVDPAAG